MILNEKSWNEFIKKLFVKYHFGQEISINQKLLRNVFLKLFKLIIKKDCILHCCPKSLKFRQIILLNKNKNLWFDIPNWVKMTNDFHQKSSCLTAKDNDNHHLTKDEQKKFCLFYSLICCIWADYDFFYCLKREGLDTKFKLFTESHKKLIRILHLVWNELKAELILTKSIKTTKIRTSHV
jgi:hypothetical protein